MLEAIILFLNTRLRVLFSDFELMGLCELVADEGKEFTAPAEYCSDGEYQPINFDAYKALVYYRKTGDVIINRLDESTTPTCDIYESHTFPIKLVLYAPKNIYGTDNAHIDDKLANNVKKAIQTPNDRTLNQTLKSSLAQILVSDYTTDRNEVIGSEFQGAKVDVKIPFDKVFISLDLEVKIEGKLSCFEYYGCGDVVQDITFCPVVRNSAGELLVSGSPGGGEVTIEDSTIFDSHGNILYEVPATEDQVVADSNVSNSDSSYSVDVPAQSDLVLPDSEIKDSAGNLLYTLPATSDQTIEDSTIRNSDNSYNVDVLSEQTLVLPDSHIRDAIGNLLHTLPATRDQVISDSTVKNSAGTTIGTVHAEAIVTLPDKNLLNTEGTDIGDIVQGVDKVAPDGAINKAGGTQLMVVPSGASRTTTQVLDAMTGAEILADINTNGAPQKAIVARGLDNEYSYTVNFSTIADDTRAFQLTHFGTIDVITPTNLSAYTFKINGSVVTAPFTHNRGDLLTITITRANSAIAASIVLTGVDSTENNAALSAADQATDRYIAVVNPVDQTVSVIDTSIIKNNLNSHSGGLWGGLNPVIATITLTPVASYRSIAYRQIDKCWYVFANNRVVRIDADPASGTFGTILSNFVPSGGLGSQASGVAYDFDRDMFWVQDISGNGFFKCTPAGTSTRISLMSSGTSAVGLVNYLPGLRSAWLGSDLFDTINEVRNGGINSGSPLGSAGLNRKNGILYVVENSRMYVVNAATRALVASLSNNARRAGIAVNESGDRVYAGDMFGTTIAVVNSSTNTTVTNLSKANIDTNEGGTGDVLYSKYAVLVFGLGFNATGSVTTGNSRLHVIDPTTNTDKGYVTVGQQGGTNIGVQITRMALNRLQL